MRKIGVLLGRHVRSICIETSGSIGAITTLDPLNNSQISERDTCVPQAKNNTSLTRGAARSSLAELEYYYTTVFGMCLAYCSYDQTIFRLEKSLHPASFLGQPRFSEERQVLPVPGIAYPRVYHRVPCVKVD